MKIFPSLLIIALMTSSVVAESRENKNHGKRENLSHTIQEPTNTQPRLAKEKLYHDTDVFNHQRTTFFT